MADFVDGTEVDKIRNTAKIFSFMAKFVFNWVMDSRNRYRFIVWKKQIKYKKQRGKEAKMSRKNVEDSGLATLME